MKILVFGRSGQVATALRRRAPAGVAVVALGREAADLMDPAACAGAVAASGADAVINAAAWTAVDRAEAEEDAARVVNAEAPGAMARAAAEAGVPLVQISTDYVFDGSGTAPWRPGDPTGPINAYGRTKLAGEDLVRAAGGAHAVLRTSWVVSAHGANFVTRMLELGRTREALRVVDDQVGGPTPAEAVADACLTLAAALRDGAPSGTHHLAGQPFVSWAGLARATMREAGLACRIEPIPSSAWPTPARRPMNSRLDGGSLLAGFGIAAPDWREGLARAVREAPGG